MAKKDTFKEFAVTILGSGNVGAPLPTASEHASPFRENEVSQQPQTAAPTRTDKATTSINEHYVQRSFFLREDLSDQLALISTKTKRSLKAIFNELVQDFVDKNRQFLD